MITPRSPAFVRRRLCSDCVRGEARHMLKVPIRLMVITRNRSGPRSCGPSLPPTSLFRVADTGAIDEYMQSTEMLRCRGDGGTAIGVRSHVALDEAGIGTKRARKRFAELRLEICDDDFRA